MKAKAADLALAADAIFMRRAIEVAWTKRTQTSPNPWVGAVLVSASGRIFEAATSPPPGPHAEASVLAAAREEARGASLYVTLEPCSHFGRTPPCTQAIVAAGVERVVVGVEDPDPRVSGSGIRALAEAGVSVVVGVEAEAVEAQLAPYLAHRRRGWPWVVVKLALSLDGHIAAKDGSSRWITGEEARRDAQLLRAESDAIVVGANTVRVDNPRLTVRLPGAWRQPLRVVMGRFSDEAAVAPALSWEGPPEELLRELGSRGVLQVLVEGGAQVAGEFHAARLVDRYVFYLAPMLLGGGAIEAIRGWVAESMEEAWRGRILSVREVGGDLRLEVAPS